MPQVRIYGRPRLLITLVCILLVLSIIDDYQGWRFLLLGLASTWVLSALWVRALAHGLSLEREMRFGWSQVGDRLEERFTLQNNSPVPALWVEVHSGSDMPGYCPDLVTGSDSGSTNRWHTSGRCTRRGLFTLGPTTLQTGDPLGLYTVEIDDPHTVQLMVMPPVVPLPHIDVSPGGRMGVGRPRPQAAERTISAESVRAYMPGDSLRWIHWRTSARRNDLYVRTFENTPSGDWWILLDVEERVQAGQGAHSTLEHGVILAASLLDRGLRLGRSVGLAALGEPPAWLLPRPGEAQRWEALRALALLEESEHSLSELLERLPPATSRDASLVIITPREDGDWLEALLPLLWRGAIPTLLLMDRQAFNEDVNPPGNQSFNASTPQYFSELGIHPQYITPDIFERPEAQPGRQGEWEWRVTPTGRAVSINRANERPWRRMA
jgi:uncharacterized protein (DUF58 family)